MPTPLQLIRGERYEIEPSYQGDGRMPSPSPQAMGPAGGPATEAEPSYAQLLAETGGQGMPPGPEARALAPQHASAMPVANQGQPMPSQSGPGQPDWMTPERKRMYEKAKRAAQNYRMAVDARRQKRRQSSEYGKLYHQMQAERGKVDQIENMMTTYKDMFRPDDPRTEHMIRQQMQHFETAERLTNDLRRRLQKQGIKLGPKDNLPEDPWGADGGDEQFDQFIMQGYNEALMTDPHGQ